jgi:quercetin dioxygenase-like cupin family protein
MNIKLLGSALVAALAVAAPSFGSATLGDAPPVVATPIAVGTMQATTIHATTGAMELVSIRVPPGGSFGWHKHGSPVAVVVTSGTLTVFDPAVASCKPFKVSRGQSFVEPANHVHLARNDGKVPAKLYAMYLGVPKGANANDGVTAPSGCNA